MENLNKFGDKLLDYLNSAELFIKDQAPDFVQQFIAYETWKVEWLMIVSATVLAIFVVLQSICIFISIKERKSDIVGIILVVGLMGSFSLGWFIDSYFDVQKLKIAPKVYMVEKAKELVTKQD